MKTRPFRGFTLIELLIAIAIIAILASLVMPTLNYVQTRAKKECTRQEISGLEAALESYKVDNGGYPQGDSTDSLDAADPTATARDLLITDSGGVPGLSAAASMVLYQSLSGDANADRTIDAGERSAVKQIYFPFPPSMLYPKGAGTVEAMVDPFGNVYGYSTRYKADLLSGNPAPGGFNPTFDLWSSADSDKTGATGTASWITNW